METPVSFESINGLIVRRSPVAETLRAIISQIMSQQKFALARIWLIDGGDICDICPMRAECPDQTRCLHLTASAGRGREDDVAEPRWTTLDGRFSRFPIGVRKIGHVAATGEAVMLDELERSENPWIVEKDWIRAEGITSFAALPLRFEDDVIGVVAVFSRAPISADDTAWLRLFAGQASIAIANARAFEEIDSLRQKLEDENDYLRETVNPSTGHDYLIGRSPVWQKIIGQIELVGPTDATVLVTGESGTGKELVARAVHDASARRDSPLVRVNCAAISPELFESEFFGHAKGAFTGAAKDRAGRFQVADGGTIFLDEIGELPLALQGKLLRVLQEKQYERVGEDRTRTVDVRVVAATNRDLAEQVENGSFRRDLYYRLTVFPIHLPPLRERPEDIAPLAAHFLERNGRAASELSPDDLSTLEKYWYPGNVRELQNIVERAVILARCRRLNFSLPEVLDRIVVDPAAAAPSADIMTYEGLRELERENIRRALRRSVFRVYGRGGAAELLGAKPTTLLSRIKSLGIAMRPEA